MHTTDFASNQMPQTMNPHEQATQKLPWQLEKRASEGFTGKLDVVSNQESWTLLFCLGRLVWAVGGKHPNRRFRRIWQQTCPQVALSDFAQLEAESSELPCYQILRAASRQGKISQEQIKSLVARNCQEVLFDILYQEASQAVIYNASPEGGLDKVATLMSGLVLPRQVLPHSEETQQAWHAAGLSQISPDCAPVILHKDKLQQATAPTTYQVLVKVIDGQRSLRDLAAATQKELWRLGKSLLPLIQKGIIKLKEVADLPSATTPVKPKAKKTAKPKPSIACIDDTPEVLKQMEQIVTKAGCRFVGIQDSVQALPTLLESKPDLIFLDLVMPVANGYEVCSQIRRVEALKDIPVVILTGRDGMVDRVRARMVGANDFMSKPVEFEKVFASMKENLKASQASS
ncbi:response regulator [Geitlerinema sp. PCC 9228]|uniref:response regulator n=1 Tax=Geitlerinema sp. PCC 9228 TaxID=111611 RepID=UPI0009FEBBB9|nr:response regulator [Geitlerinema sp. PCC 9228]